MNELALFAGAGGGILGGRLLGWRTVCAVECDDYARRVLMARQDDRCLEPFPIWDDVRTFDGKPWAGLVDVVSGGFPCQDISVAGKGAGLGGERSGLWSEMARIVREVGPRFVFVENSPALTARGLGRVLGDLAAMGYDARWGVLGAVHAGAPHRRERIWIVADSSGRRFCEQREGEIQQQRGAETFGAGEDVADAFSNGRQQGRSESARQQGRPTPIVGCAFDANTEGKRLEGHGDGAAIADCRSEQGFTGAACSQNSTWWKSEPDVGRVAHGVASRVDRLRCLGNGQVPAVAKLAWEVLK
jgi:DNA (cytosine-5)-methyltransferase 1